MKFCVRATAITDHTDQMEVFAPDLPSAIEVADGIRQRHENMTVEVRDPFGEIVSSLGRKATVRRGALNKAR